MKRIVSRFFTLSLTVLLLTGCDNIANFVKGAIEDTIRPPKPTIVFCHGLNGDSSHLQTIEQALKPFFPEARMIPTHEPNSATKPIQNQSKDLLKELEGANLDKSKPVVFIAHSQGGLRAYPVALELKAQNFKVSMVTLGTPWEGSRLIDILVNSHKYSTLNAHIKAVKTNALVRGFIQIIERQAKNAHKKVWGILDMIPESNFLTTKIHPKLKRNKIPILAIGGNISSLPNEVLQEFPALKSLYKSSNALMNNQGHDLAVQLSSQLATNINADYFEKAPVTAIHVSLSLARSVPSELTSPKVIEKIIEFIRKKAK